MANSRETDGTLYVLGLMTGTSCDGLDGACIEISADGWQSLWSFSRSYPPALRKRVIELQKPKTRVSVHEMMKLHRDLGEWYAQSVEGAIKSGKNRPAPHVICNHGQTVAHYPQDEMTLQMGDAARIAARTGLTVVCSLRDGDLAAGGQGAPLVPLFHKLLAEGLRGDAQKGIAFHNIGGISNLTYISPSGDALAFDTGPGNIWIDSATELATRGKQKFDKGGALAARGTIDTKGAGQALKHRYFGKRAPKSTGRDDFPFELLRKASKAKGADLVATATAITVESIAEAYERSILDCGLPLDTIYVCGGGAKNETLLEWLRARMEGVEVTTIEDIGLDSQLIEAQAFAVFGYLSLLGLPVGGPWTGVKGWAPPGHIVPGLNWPEVMRRISSAVQR